MKVFANLLCVFILVAVFAGNVAYAQAPLCDVTCTPDPTSSSYAGAAVARAKMLNARGDSSPIVATARLNAKAGALSSDTTVLGSQSYNHVIPILRIPGRAGMDLVLNLYYNSRVWDVDTVNATATFNADRDFPSYGFRMDLGFLEYDLASDMYIVTEEDGTKHSLPGPGYDSIDGTFIHYNNANGVLSYRNGATKGFAAVPSQQGQVHPKLFRPYWAKDTNGNIISISYVTGHDQLVSTINSLGRIITFNYDASNRLASLTQALHPSGSKTYATFQWGTKYGSGYAWYNFSGLTVSGTPDLNTPLNVLTGCTYPNGTGYRFTYGDWGIINKIETLSSTSLTRSYVSYNYPAASTAQTDAPTYTQQTISPDGGTGNLSIWSYAATKAGTGVVTSMAVTDPNGTISTTNLDPNTGLTSSAQVTDGASHLLRKTDFTWTTSGAATVPGSVTTTLGDTGQQSSVQYVYDSYGNATTISEYDFGPVLKRQTVSTYATGAYVTQHILNLPTQILIKDGGSGATVSRTDLAYDTTTLTAITGAANHDDTAYGASFTTRGNLTSVTRFANAAAGTGDGTRTFNYDSLGNLLVAQLDCCNQKTFNFSSGTQYSAPDSIVRGASGGTQFTTSYTYNVDNNLLLTSTDENGQVTQYQYDSMSRTTQALLPPQGGTQVQANTAFDDAAVSPAITSSNTANSAVTTATLDGLGHVMRVDNKNGSTVVSSVTNTYDKLWQRTQGSNPFAPGDTVINTAFSYDAQGRVMQVTPPSAGSMQYQYAGNTVVVTDPAGKQRRNVTDVLGRLTEVDEPGETFAGSASAGTLTIGGTLRSQSGVGAAPGTGSVTIGGGAQSACCDGNGALVTDSGTVSITVNGFTDTVSYNNGSPCCPSFIAQYLTNGINSDNPYVFGSASGSTVNLTAKSNGSGTNYSLSSSSTYDFWNTGLFTQPSFTESPSGSTLTGGSDGVTVVDSGTVTVTIGSTGFTASAPYNQSGNSTPAMVVAALIGTGPTGLNRAGSPVHATANGASISLAYNSNGAAGNVTVTTVSGTNDPAHFPGGSFSGSAALSGGADAYTAGLNHPYVTTYTYDALDNLTAVSQAAGNVNGQPVSGQPRTYVYDSLGRITSATTPESGTVTTYYTTSGGAACSGDTSLQCRVQDARGVVKTFTYDGINRVTGITYSDGTPSVTYQYDAGGAAAFALDRLTKITEGPTNSQTFTYDNFGRITKVSQVIDGTTYPVQYAFNLASELTSITYPTNRVVTQNYDAIGRPSSIASGSTTYLSGLSYNAAGEALALTMGNGVQGTFTYNDHLQLATLKYVNGTTNILNLAYDYTTGVPGNNGQIQAVHYYTSPGVEDLTKSENFTYDRLGRLSAANTTTVNSTPGTWSLQWGYDRLGNRLSQTLVGGSVTIGQPSFAIDPATNRIVGYCYDAVGNLLDEAACPAGSHQYAYDGANRLTKINAGPPTYTYFGALRIKKVVGSATTVYIYSGNTPIVEYVNGSLSKEYIHAGATLLATISGTSTAYHHPDHLSDRAETDASGTRTRTFGHFPFGETWYEPTGTDKWKFTSYENDSGTGETGLNYAQFRYHSGVQGRFMSADLLAGSLSAPQSLNRYSYVSNDPVNRIDPFGLRDGDCFGIVGKDENGDYIFAPVPCPDNKDGGPSSCDGSCDDGVDPWPFFLPGVPPAPIPDLFPGTPPPPLPPPCITAILNAVNKQFGVNLTPGNQVTPAGMTGTTYVHGGGFNVFLQADNLTQSQFGALRPGRYVAPGDSSFDPSLHIPGNGGESEGSFHAVFQKNPETGTVTFSAHIDSAAAVNPLATAKHYKVDVAGAATRNPCPVKK